MGACTNVIGLAPTPMTSSDIIHAVSGKFWLLRLLTNSNSFRVSNFDQFWWFPNDDLSILNTPHLTSFFIENQTGSAVIFLSISITTSLGWFPSDVVMSACSPNLACSIPSPIDERLLHASYLNIHDVRTSFSFLARILSKNSRSFAPYEIVSALGNCVRYSFDRFDITSRAKGKCLLLKWLN